MVLVSLALPGCNPIARTDIKSQLSMTIRQAAKPGGGAAVRAATSGAAEFAAQFRDSFRVLWLIAVGIVGESGLAEDVVQEAAIIALGKLDQFRPGTSFTAWVGQIVRNVALNRARRERRHRAASFDALDEFAPATGIAKSASQESKADAFDQRLVRALAFVGPVPRACLLLRTLEGMEYSQIARLLGIPEGTAMSHVHRTRADLRERLADLWDERSADAAERA